MRAYISFASMRVDLLLPFSPPLTSCMPEPSPSVISHDARMTSDNNTTHQRLPRFRAFRQPSMPPYLAREDIKIRHDAAHYRDAFHHFPAGDNGLLCPVLARKDEMR